jgi:solute carrier family 25 phosphate transporter 23/24/25/41
MLLQGDVSLSAEDKPPPFTVDRPIFPETTIRPIDHLSLDVSEDDGFEEYEPEAHHSWLEGHAAIKFLTAGGIAGAGE